MAHSNLPDGYDDADYYAYCEAMEKMDERYPDREGALTALREVEAAHDEARAHIAVLMAERDEARAAAAAWKRAAKFNRAKVSAATIDVLFQKTLRNLAESDLAAAEVDAVRRAQEAEREFAEQYKLGVKLWAWLNDTVGCAEMIYAEMSQPVEERNLEQIAKIMKRVRTISEFADSIAPREAMGDD